MKPEEHWDPRRSLAVMIAIFGFICVLLTGMGSDERLGQTLLRGFVVATVCAIAGYLCGIVVKVLFRELPEPESADFLRLRGEFTKTLDGLPEEVSQAFYDSLSEGSGEEADESQQDQSADSKEENVVKIQENDSQEKDSQEKERAMVSDSS